MVAVGTRLGWLVPELASKITIERHFFAWVPVRDSERFTPARVQMWIRESLAATRRPIEDSHAHSVGILAFGFPAAGRRARGARRLQRVPLRQQPQRRLHHRVPARRPELTVLGGFSGHGFKHGPAVGEVPAALVTGERPPVDVRPWSPSGCRAKLPSPEQTRHL